MMEKNDDREGDYQSRTGGLIRAWVPPPPVIFVFDPKKPKPESFAAYTILQMHAAFKAGLEAAHK